MGKFFKEAGIDWGKIGKEFVGPGLVIGGGVGAGVTVATKKKGEKLDGKTLAKGVGAGIIGDAVTGIGQGLWNQRKLIGKL